MRDGDTGLPVKTAVVAFGGHASGFADDLVGGIDRGAHYAIKGIPLGTYPDVAASAPGYDTAVATNTIVRGPTRQDFSLRRDWAAGPGGATVVSSSGDAEGCPAGLAIDQSSGNGWIAPFVADGAGLVPQQVTVALPSAVDVSRFGIDPSPTCGFGGSAELKGWRLETSTDGVTYTTAAEGSFRPQDAFRLNLVRPTAGAERRALRAPVGAVEPRPRRPGRLPRSERLPGNLGRRARGLRQELGHQHDVAADVPGHRRRDLPEARRR